MKTKLLSLALSLGVLGTAAHAADFTSRCDRDPWDVPSCRYSGGVSPDPCHAYSHGRPHQQEEINPQLFLRLVQNHQALQQQQQHILSTLHSITNFLAASKTAPAASPAAPTASSSIPDIPVVGAPAQGTSGHFGLSYTAAGAATAAAVGASVGATVDSLESQARTALGQIHGAVTDAQKKLSEALASYNVVKKTATEQATKIIQQVPTVAIPFLSHTDVQNWFNK